MKIKVDYESTIDKLKHLEIIYCTATDCVLVKDKKTNIYLDEQMLGKDYEHILDWVSEMRINNSINILNKPVTFETKLDHHLDAMFELYEEKIIH